MGRKPDYIRKKYAPLQQKTLRNSLAYCLGKEFPRLGGERILNLCADMILEVISNHIRPREQLTHGQVLWLGISVDDPPTRGKRTAFTQLIPVVLNLSTAADIQARLERKSPAQRLLTKALRLCTEAYHQGALLSNCDLAELLTTADGSIANVLAQYERETGKIVPRRATLHDMGTGLTHKRIICWKRFAEGKSSAQIARETYHSLEAVDHYLGQYDRVRHCHLQEMPPEEIAYVLKVSLSLVNEYLKIDKELEKQHA